jgi:hypothetical protein
VLDRSVLVARTFLATTLKRCRGGRDIVEALACAVTAGVGATEARGTAATLKRSAGQSSRLRRAESSASIGLLTELA